MYGCMYQVHTTQYILRPCVAIAIGRYVDVAPWACQLPENDQAASANEGHGHGALCVWVEQSRNFSPVPVPSGIASGPATPTGNALSTVSIRTRGDVGYSGAQGPRHSK